MEACGLLAVDVREDRDVWTLRCRGGCSMEGARQKRARGYAPAAAAAAVPFLWHAEDRLREEVGARLALRVGICPAAAAAAAAFGARARAAPGFVRTPSVVGAKLVSSTGSGSCAGDGAAFLAASRAGCGDVLLCHARCLWPSIGMLASALLRAADSARHAREVRAPDCARGA